MNLSSIQHIYFIGIGGIGMSALARYFKAIGKSVAGYDKVATDITNALQELAIEVHYEDDINLIDPKYLKSDETLVVYTPAIPSNHKELNHFQEHDFLVLKRAEVLGLITRNTYCFAVAGTHGKTTTSSILGHLLKECNADMTAFLGGITENYNSNLIQNGSEISVVEADEFDRSFLSLSPNVACITSMDADHLDIYGESEALEESFRDFARKISNEKRLFVKYGLPIDGVTFGLEMEADFGIENIKIINGSYHFTIRTPKERIDDVVFHLPGAHNITNALVAFAMAYNDGFEVACLVKGLDTFKGVKRRFSYQIKTDELVFIDDYAHHPTEINAVHQAVREMYPNEKVFVVFQPHLFSRTQDFADDFAASLSDFDIVRLLDIYPARELPIEGVNGAWLLGKITNENKKLIHKKDIVSEMVASSAKIVLTLGAGDIGAEVQEIKENLENEIAMG